MVMRRWVGQIAAKLAECEHESRRDERALSVGDGRLLARRDGAVVSRMRAWMRA
jgi:hypothetical protein